MCSYSSHICLKFGKIQFINQGFITEKPCISHFSPKFLGPLAEKLGAGSQNSCLWKKWYGRLLSTCQVWWRSVYARQHKIENNQVLVFLFLSCWTWPVLVLQTCHNVLQFNEIYFCHLLINFHKVSGIFLEEKTYFQTLSAILN